MWYCAIFNIRPFSFFLILFSLWSAFESLRWVSLCVWPLWSIFLLTLKLGWTSHSLSVGSLQKLLPVLLGFSPLTICFFLVNLLHSWSEYGSLCYFLGSVKDRRSTGGPDHITGADSRPSCSLGKSLFLLGDHWVVQFLQVHTFHRQEDRCLIKKEIESVT